MRSQALFWFEPCIQELYENEQAVFDDIQSVLVQDWAELQETGLDVEGTVIYPIILGMKADWSYQASWLISFTCF